MDNLRIAESMTNSIESYNVNIVGMFPNPCNGEIFLTSDRYNDLPYVIIDVIGNIIVIDVVVSNTIHLDRLGLNIINLRDKKGKIAVVKAMNLSSY